MPTESSSSRSGTEIEEVAAELAGAVASAIAAADPGGDPPVVEMVDAAGLPISGSVDIAIKYKDTEVGLTGKLPGSDPEDAYEFTLTLKRKGDANPTEIGKFKFVHGNDWSVSVNMPRQPIGQNFVIEKIQVTITKVPPEDDFSISVLPKAGAVVQGGSVDTVVSTEITRGVAQTVSLSASGLPAGATAAFTPPSVEAGEDSTLTISAASTTPPGTYTIVITGTDGTSTHTTNYSLAVSSA